MLNVLLPMDLVGLYHDWTPVGGTGPECLNANEDGKYLATVTGPSKRSSFLAVPFNLLDRDEIVSVSLTPTHKWGAGNGGTQGQTIRTFYRDSGGSIVYVGQDLVPCYDVGDPSIEAPTWTRYPTVEIPVDAITPAMLAAGLEVGLEKQFANPNVIYCDRLELRLVVVQPSDRVTAVENPYL